MISVNISGGLGNQLFQIMTLIAYSKKYSNQFIIEKKPYSPGCTFRNVYWSNLLNKLQQFLINGQINFQKYEEPSYEYNELPIISDKDNLILSGYFQSYKYFDMFKKQIICDLDLETKKTNVKNKIVDVNIEEMVSMHFRIGDIIRVHRNNYQILNIEYYINALKYIESKDKNIKVLYFCEEEDITFVKNSYINPLKNMFPNIIFVQTDAILEDWEQMLLMSSCKHHIIANSTYSWWSAYLSDDIKNKIICYPNKWSHSTIIKDDTIDLFPNNWIMCDTEYKNYSLENVYYINLKNSRDRRIDVEKELKQMNWKYQRFDAIKNIDGRIGCCLSHLKVIEMAKANNLDYVVVVEDDIQFIEPDKYNKMLCDFKDYMGSNNNYYDVLLLGANIPDKVNGLKQINTFIYQVFLSHTTTGYIVKKHYYDKLIENYKESIQLLMHHSNINTGCIDVNWVKLQKTDRWFILLPRTINQKPSYSIIQNCYTNYSHVLLD